jgi:demethylmenaquinone methyltransferase / 2-methoxy-6-polyprenyl-1,4-benzoquinol methylase
MMMRGTMTQLEPIAHPEDVRAMFNRIAPGYDHFNALASFGMHQSWRDILVKQIPPGARVLDIATGTGDVAFKARAQAHEVVGLDFSEPMITRARKKDKNGSILWMTGSAEALPFAENSFGCVTSAFALRNFRRTLDAVFQETFRVLKPGGVVLHLDFGRPRAPLMRWGHRLHMTFGVPLIGRMVLRERWPQGYLKSTINQFFEPAEVEDHLEAAGFINVGHRPVFGGVVQLYRGTKAC